MVKLKYAEQKFKNGTFVIENPGLNKIIGVQNQLPIKFGTAFIWFKILKV